MKALHIITPVFEALALNRQLNKAIFLKMEAFQPTGSFKIRGLGKLCQDYASKGYKHFVASSGGNAGIAAAYAGRKLNIPTTVYVPTTTAPSSIEQIQLQGADVIIVGDVWDITNKEALTHCEEPLTAYIPPFDHPLIWSGHATLIEEMKNQAEKPEAIIASVGGGGLMCGILEGLHRVGWKDVPVIAAEPIGAASFHAAQKAGKVVILENIDTLAKTLAAKTVTPKLLEWNKIHSITSVIVEDKQALHACDIFKKQHRVLVEPACGVALSLLYDNHPAIHAYEKIAVIVCGGAGI